MFEGKKYTSSLKSHTIVLHVRREVEQIISYCYNISESAEGKRGDTW
jgi:hypothetical protein